MWHLGCDPYKICLNNNPSLTFIGFTRQLGGEILLALLFPFFGIV